MPLYDYKCRACSKVTEVRHAFREPYDGSCPECGGDLARVFNPAGIVFKGSGFYLTDSRKPAPSESGSTSGSSSPSGSGSSAGASSSTDAKPAATTPAASTPSSGDSGSKKSESSAA